MAMVELQFLRDSCHNSLICGFQGSMWQAGPIWCGALWKTVAGGSGHLWRQFFCPEIFKSQNVACLENIKSFRLLQYQHETEAR